MDWNRLQDNEVMFLRGKELLGHYLFPSEFDWLEEDGQIFLHLLAFEAEVIERTEEANTLLGTPNVEINLPQDSNELSAGETLKIPSYDDELGNLTNLYVGLHLGITGKLHIDGIDRQFLQFRMESKLDEDDLAGVTMRWKGLAKRVRSEGRSFD